MGRLFSHWSNKMSTDLQSVIANTSQQTEDDQLLALMEENERLKREASQLQTLVDTLKSSAGPSTEFRQPGEREFEVMAINKPHLPASRHFGVDESEAIRRFHAAHGINDTYKYTCRAICVDQPTLSQSPATDDE